MNDAVVIGSGPNGLAAACYLARRGHSVLVLEGADRIGGGARSEEITKPGFVHDVCSAIHPFGVASPYLRTLPLQDHGLQWVHPGIPLAHPLDDGTAVALHRSIDATAAGLAEDGQVYRRIFGPLAGRFEELSSMFLGPPRSPTHPLLAARFGMRALRSARGLAGSLKGERARAFVAGLAAHSILPLDRPVTASFALMLAAAAHASGWPVARGGSQAIADALASVLRTAGGEVVTGRWVGSFDDLPPARAYLFDTTPRQLIDIAGDRLSIRKSKRLARFRYGPGAFKVDFALSAPVPWKAKECAQAGTVHLGGTFGEIARSEAAMASGRTSERPYVIVAQQSLFDDSRSPEGAHTLWAYCHVPANSTVDLTEAIVDQIERFAPGFREVVIASRSMGPHEMEAHNPNYIGGDIAAGSHGGLQLFARPTLSLDPYSIAPGIFLCSASTPPGAGVHGMCGYRAARSAERYLRPS